MSRKTNNMLLMIIGNAISLICFTTLAIIFKSWWIIFFAYLFSYRYESDKE